MRGVSSIRFLRGTGGMMASALLFGLMAFGVRIASRSVPEPIIVFIRSLGGLGIFLLLGTFKAVRFNPVRKDLLVLRGFFGAGALMLWFYGIGEMGLSKAVFYFYSYPFYTALFSGLFYGEKLQKAKIAGMAVTAAGLVLLSGFWSMGFEGKDMAGLLSGALAGVAMSYVHELRKTDNSWTIVLVFLLFSTVLSFPFAAWSFKPIARESWTVLLFIPLVATFSQMLMTYSFKYCSPTQGSLVSSTAVVFPSVLGYVFLGENLLPAEVLGGALIVSGGILSSFAPEESY